jgi:hypothetical protein
MGNHEFYGQRPMNNLWRKAREKVEGTHVHLLENESLLLDDPRNPGERVRFLGATLWTDFAILGADQQEKMMLYAREVMTDYSVIYMTTRSAMVLDNSISGYPLQRRGDRLTPRKTLSLHHESRDFLEQQLRRVADDFDFLESWAKTVVVTHHAPSANSLIYQEAALRTDAAYASDLEYLIPLTDLWIHGHTHVPADYRIGAGRVLSNPRGYVGHGAVADFDPGFVVEV